ncbi:MULTISPECIES: ABC transporter substrate-binding protein [unclassified Streptomyces]|uniref:ABC transporter substrate-binding protein n=1 Tax=unclassified Streptomyces TaxID=2593676 RepID=UPI002E80B973|nr:ABC transporter substrate-binding protein [Streptomyces sp. NBC_00589]WTI35327.1 ABC transporter substrate-binding protein [Streptomyces sp. NBC_00775]WUB30999.1 ABC transporter substrate-binding protein [Streptomyces sp. NBC_00589]
MPSYSNPRTPERLVISRRRLLAAIGAGGALLAVSACRSAADESGKSSGAAAKGGTLKIAQSADIAPATLFGQNNPNFTLARTVFNTLTECDHKTLQPKPSLAESWTEAKDGTSITLKLRQGVTFHSGRAFTSADVAFAIENLRKDTTASQLKHVALAIEKIDQTDEHTVTLHLAHPVSNLFDLFEILLIVDKESIDELLKGTKIIGTGPFKVADYTPGTGFQLKRNDAYWKKGVPLLDAVEVSVVSQSPSMVSSLRSGGTHLLVDVAPLDAASIKNDDQFEVTVSDAHDSGFYIASNVKVKPLDDKRVRQAIAWAVDRERILSQVLGGIGTVTSLPWATSSPAYDKTKAAHYSRDLKTAKALIKAAGAGGKTVKVVYNAGLATNAKIAEIVQYDLTQLGLKANAEPLQAADFLAQLQAGELPGLFINGHGFGQLHPATLVKGAFPFNADKNASNFDSDAYRTLADQLWQATEETEAKKAADALNDLLLEEQFVSDLVASSHTFTRAKKVQGLNWTMYDYLDLDQTSIG